MPTVPAESPAYDPTRLTGGVVYRWALGVAVAIHVDTTGQDALGVDLREAAARGLEAWRPTWRYAELRPRLVASAADADVVIQLADAPPLVQLAGCASGIAGAAGRTVLCAAGDTARTLPLLAPGDPGRVKVAVELDGHAVSGASHAVTLLDALVAHELGHVLGIGGHSPLPTDLMYAAPAVARPSQRDAATLRYVLHQPGGFRLR